MTKPKVYRGDYYWKSFSDARAWRDANMPGGRIVNYSRGWAVQLHVSGPYAGPDFNAAAHACAWCPK
jgi:hypothetical protein